MDLAVGRPVYAFDASREEHRAMPAYEKPPVLLGDDYYLFIWAAGSYAFRAGGHGGR